MRDLMPEEVAAAWLYGAEYSQQNLGIIDWYAGQDASRKRVVREFVAKMHEAFARSGVFSAPRPKVVDAPTMLRMIATAVEGHVTLAPQELAGVLRTIADRITSPPDSATPEADRAG